MRIRKNAKASQLSISTPSSSSSNPPYLGTHHLQCQLNQSPWDVITFPPQDSYSSPYSQVELEEDFGSAGNGSFEESIGAIHSTESMKTCMESEVKLNSDGKWDFREENLGDERETQIGFNEQVKGEVEEEDVVLCRATDGKGWQCGRVVKKGHQTCWRHLKKGNYIVKGDRKSDNTIAPIARRGRGRPRIKKKEELAPKNPYEFYYYSGFGPQWGKKKGPGGRATGNAAGIDDSGTITSKNGDTITIKGSQWKTEDEEIDYMECDDDDEDDDEEQENGKERGRKRIKARSLKSLM